MTGGIHDFPDRLRRAERALARSPISDRNKDLIRNFERHCFAKGFEAGADRKIRADAADHRRALPRRTRRFRRAGKRGRGENCCDGGNGIGRIAKYGYKVIPRRPTGGEGRKSWSRGSS